MGLQQKLREDAQIRMEELEESLLEKDQEVQRLEALVSKLQGEVLGRTLIYVALNFETAEHVQL